MPRPQPPSSRRWNAALLACVVAASWARGEPLTLAEARARAAQNGPEVLLAVKRAELAHTQVAAATPLPNPTLAVTSARQTAKLGTTVSLPLQLFGQRGTQRDALEREATSAELDTTALRTDARWTATLAWVDLWEAQRRTALLDDAVVDAKRVAQVAAEKFGAGSSPRVDVLRTAAELARIGAEAAAARQTTLAAAERLALTVGVEQQLEAQGALHFVDEVPTVDQLLLRIGEHPTLARDRARIDAADLHLTAERRGRWPQVTPQVTVNLFDPTLAGPDFIFGLSLEVPVLDQRTGVIDRAVAQRSLAELEAALERARLSTAVSEGSNRARAAHLRLRALTEDVLPLLDEARQLTDEGYQSGYFDLVRLLDARRAALETRLAIVDAHATWARAMADVERAAGVELLAEEATHAP